jgi:hypothetical protein
LRRADARYNFASWRSVDDTPRRRERERDPEGFIASPDCSKIPHDLRRTAVRNYIRAGVPQVVAMQYTGHETDSIFRRYNIVSKTDIAEAARLMSGRHVVNR